MTGRSSAIKRTRLFIIVCSVFLLGCCVGAVFQRQLGLRGVLRALGAPVDRELGANQQSRIALLNSLPVPNGSVVFLGDSLVDFHEWHEVFPDQKVVTRAISGAMSRDFVGFCDLEEAGAVFSLIGANDIGNNIDLEEFEKNYREMIGRFSGDLKVYIISIPPIRKHGGHRVDPATVVRFNERLKTIASQGGHAFIDFHSTAGDGEGLFAGDGLHLSSAGYSRLVEQLNPMVVGSLGD